MKTTRPYTRMTQDKAVRFCASHMQITHYALYTRMYEKGMTLEEAVRMGDRKDDRTERKLQTA